MCKFPPISDTAEGAFAPNDPPPPLDPPVPLFWHHWTTWVRIILTRYPVGECKKDKCVLESFHGELVSAILHGWLSVRWGLPRLQISGLNSTLNIPAVRGYGKE